MKQKKTTSAQNEKRVLRAGVARREITTDTRPGEIHDPLWVKALVLDDGNTPLAILSLDAVAIGGIGDIPDEYLPALRNRIEKKLGIPGTSVLVHATHTHPSGRLICDSRKLLDRSFAAVRQAFNDRTAVTAGFGSGREDRIMMNRTLRLKNGGRWTVRQAYPCPPDEEVAGLGPTDPEIGLIRIDHLDGRPLAVLYNFAGHPLLGVPNGKITANYPGFASAIIEEQLGSGALAFFLQGAGGDQTEILYKDVNRPRDARPGGIQLGWNALKVWRTIRPGAATLAVASRTIELPRRMDVSESVAALRKQQTELLASLRYTSLNFRSFLPLLIRHTLNPRYPGDYAYRYMQEEKIGSDDLRSMDAENQRNLDKYLQNIRAMEKLSKIEDDIATLLLHQEQNRSAGESSIRVEVQGLRIGDGALISSPAENLVEVGLRLKRRSPFRHTLIAAFSNGYVHYGTPAAEYERGGYESTECMLASGWQRIYEKAALDILRELA
ncbi:MAG: hypothetical protein U1E27_13800 [Kiritimatiellia bacterium]|nr:hypothetical protein [Kiritimatiellia bacterium]